MGLRADGPEAASNYGGETFVSELIGVVGSRKGADLQQVKSFLMDLGEKYPDSILVSGGALGVDSLAETTWQMFGGAVVSYRPIERSPGSFGIDVWELGGERPRMYPLVDFPEFADYGSACLARDTVIAEKVDRLAAFYCKGKSRGTQFTVEVTQGYGKPVYIFEAA